MRLHGIFAASFVFAVPALAIAQGQGQGHGQGKTAICHIPPGNPSKARVLYLPEAAINAHLEHGDTLGDCGGNGVESGSAIPTRASARTAAGSKHSTGVVTTSSLRHGPGSGKTVATTDSQVTSGANGPI